MSVNAIQHDLCRNPQVSVQVKKQAQQEAELFESPVLEYGRMTTALKTALHKRHEKKITYMTAAHDLEAKKAHLGKLEGMGSDRPVSARLRGRQTCGTVVLVNVVGGGVGVDASGICCTVMCVVSVVSKIFRSGTFFMTFFFAWGSAVRM